MSEKEVLVVIRDGDVDDLEVPEGVVVIIREYLFDPDSEDIRFIKENYGVEVLEDDDGEKYFEKRYTQFTDILPKHR